MLCQRKRKDNIRQERNSALICCILANINSSKGRTYKIEDFMFTKDEDIKTTEYKMTAEQMKLVMSGIARTINKVYTKKSGRK